MPRRRLFGLLLALCLPFVAPAWAQGKEDIHIVIFSAAGEQTVAVAYEAPITQAKARDEMVRLAHAVNSPTPSVEVLSDPRGKTSATAKLTGLVNPATGEVNLDAILRTFTDYSHFRIECLFFTKPDTLPQEQTRSIPPWRYEVRSRENTVQYEVWIDHRKPIAGPLPSVHQKKNPYWAWALGIGAFALVVAGAVLLMLRILRSPAGEKPVEEALEGES